MIGPSTSFGVLPALLRVTGGRLCAGLPCRSLVVVVLGTAMIPGDCDDMDVGVVSRL